MGEFFHASVYQPLYNLLIFIYNILPGADFGFAIIATTLLLRAVLIPLYKKQIESQKKLQELQPKIKELQNKNKDNKEFYIPPMEYSVDALMAYGTQEVRQVTGGCGGSGGVSLNNSRMPEFSKPFSVKEFGDETENGKCGQCGKSAEDHHYHCPDCKREYSDERSKSAGQRTQECGCGFKFGC